MRLLLFLVITIACSISSAQDTPSFNCNKSTTQIEKSICNSSFLSNKDRDLSGRYKLFLSKLPPESKIVAKRMQRLWLTTRNNICRGSETEQCLSTQYNEWLDYMDKGVLVAKVPLEYNVNPTVSPFDSVTKVHLSSDYTLSINAGSHESVFHEGEKDDASVRISIDFISHVIFYLAQNGKKNMAFFRAEEKFGGRCEGLEEEKLIFVNIENPSKIIKSITLFEEDSRCGTYRNELFKWQVNDDGSLEFLELDNYSFYHQQKFTEIKSTIINQYTSSESYWIDKSVDSFMGTPYSQIMIDVEKGIWGLDKIQEMNGCVIPGNGLSDYWRFKEMMSNKKVGFNQIIFIAHNVLKPEYLKTAAQYKPLLKAALMYLDKAREIPNWKHKIVDAASKYPQIQASANFYFDGNADWKENPFIQSSFYTDVSCYAKARSPFGYASIEEWFYMFWARRVNDGNLEETEKLLNLLINMMEVEA